MGTPFLLDSSTCSAGAMHSQQLRTCAGRRGVTLAAWSAVCAAASCRLACMAHQHLAQGELRLASVRCAQLALASALVGVGRLAIAALRAVRSLRASLCTGFAPSQRRRPHNFWKPARLAVTKPGSGVLGHAHSAMGSSL